MRFYYILSCITSLSLITWYSACLSTNVLEVFHDKKGAEIVLRQVLDTPTFQQAAHVFTQAIVAAYADLSDEDLNWDLPGSRENYLDAVFQQQELIPFLENTAESIGVIAAFHANRLIAYISFDYPKNQEIYVRQLMVDPLYWNRGIGKRLLFSILKVVPDTRCLALVTRRKNHVSRFFYQALGFIECEEYVHAPWNPKDFIGYKKILVT